MRCDLVALYLLIMTMSAIAYRGVLPAGLLGDPSAEPDEARRIERSPRDWMVDALCFLLAIGFTAITFVDGIDRHLGPVPLAVDLTLGCLSCLGVWPRQRWPVGFAVITGLFSIYAISASGVALIALFTVAVHRRPVVAGLVATGYAFASFGTLLVRPDLPSPTWPQGVLGVACVAAVLAWGMFLRARRQLACSRREQAAAEQRLRVAQARQLERNRIAGEMHDVLAHRLSLLSLHAGAVDTSGAARLVASWTKAT